MALTCGWAAPFRTPTRSELGARRSGRGGEGQVPGPDAERGRGGQHEQQPREPALPSPPAPPGELVGHGRERVVLVEILVVVVVDVVVEVVEVAVRVVVVPPAG